MGYFWEKRRQSFLAESTLIFHRGEEFMRIWLKIGVKIRMLIVQRSSPHSHHHPPGACCPRAPPHAGRVSCCRPWCSPWPSSLPAHGLAVAHHNHPNHRCVLTSYHYTIWFKYLKLPNSVHELCEHKPTVSKWRPSIRMLEVGNNWSHIERGEKN